MPATANLFSLLNIELVYWMALLSSALVSEYISNSEFHFMLPSHVHRIYVEIESNMADRVVNNAAVV